MQSAIDTVMEALQRHQSEPPVGTFQAEHLMQALHAAIPKKTSTNRSRQPTDDSLIKARPAIPRNTRTEDFRRPRRTDDSLIKARYASSVLRVAQTADRKTAARLARGLAHDFPHPDELPEIADIHLRAIDTFFLLAADLDDAANPKQQHLWKTALDAAGEWLRAVRS
jgi:hypothetical protein